MPEAKSIEQILPTQETVKIKKNNKYIELLNKNFTLVAVLIAVVIFVIGYLLVIAPKWKVRSTKNQQLNLSLQQISGLELQSNFLSQYSSQLLNFEPKEERKIAMALPDEFDLPSIVVQLSKLASDYKFILENISVDELGSNGVDITNLKRVDIEMTVNGVDGSGYGEFSKFIEAIESSIMIFDVKAISFTPDEDGYRLELSTYYYPKQ